MKKVILFFACLAITPPIIAKDASHEKNNKVLPPGLQKKLERTGQLPPGWQKKISRGEILEPELYEIADPIDTPPEEYDRELGGTTELLRLQDKIIAIQRDTREILDVIGIDNAL